VNDGSTHQGIRSYFRSLGSDETVNYNFLQKNQRKMSLQKWSATLKRSIRPVITGIILIVILILILFALAGNAEGSDPFFTPQKLGGLGFMALLFVVFLVWAKDKVTRRFRKDTRKQEE
jgi:hypothetical protein